MLCDKQLIAHISPPKNWKMDLQFSLSSTYNLPHSYMGKHKVSYNLTPEKPQH